MGATAVGCENGTTSPGKKNGGNNEENEYDKDGYNKNGFNKDGIHKETGKPYNPQGKDKDGKTWYDEDGYDYQGYDEGGYNKNGFDRDGFDKYGYDVNGYDANGFKEDGTYMNTGLPYNPQGKKQNGETWYDNEGYDYQGYQANGFNREGNHKDTGKPYNPQGKDINGEVWRDNDGYDYQGYNSDGYDVNGFNRGGFNEDGWHRDGYFQEPGRFYDNNGKKQNGETWRDAEGYDYQGIDINGFTRLPDPPTPVPDIRNSNLINNTQASASTTTRIGKNAINNNADAVKNFFNQYGGTNPTFTNIVTTACTEGKVYATEVSGDEVIHGGLNMTGRYIIAMTNALPSTDQAKFRLMMDAYRIMAYNGNRGHGDNTSEAEQESLFIQLNATYNVNLANFDTKMNEMIIALSGALNIPRELVQTLLNQITGVERFYANRDDILALGLVPVTPEFTNISNYTNFYPTRSIQFMNQELNEVSAYFATLEHSAGKQAPMRKKFNA
jgi:hypothetical protein